MMDLGAEVKLIATKPLTYATRHLVPGDPFDASNRDGRLLIAIKKARDASKRDRVELAPPSPELAARLMATQPVVSAAPTVAASPLPENRGRPAPPSAGEVAAAAPNAAATQAAPVAATVPDTLAVNADPDAAVEPAGADLEALRAEATQLGVVVDGRWGAQRLTEAIEAARKTGP